MPVRSIITGTGKTLRVGEEVVMSGTMETMPKTVRYHGWSGSMDDRTHGVIKEIKDHNHVRVRFLDNDTSWAYHPDELLPAHETKEGNVMDKEIGMWAITTNPEELESMGQCGFLVTATEKRYARRKNKEVVLKVYKGTLENGKNWMLWEDDVHLIDLPLIAEELILSPPKVGYEWWQAECSGEGNLTISI
jgi:hypothetical protein